MRRLTPLVLALLCFPAPPAAGAPSAPVRVRELPTPVLAPSDTAASIELPRPTGPHRVGRRAFHVIDPRRKEAFTSDTTDHRELVFHVRYPASRAGGVPAAFIDAFPDDSLFQRSYAFIGFEKLARVRSHAVSGAALSDTARRYPVILFSHGLGSIDALYTTFQENLASHGYVVVGVDHTYFSAAFRLPDGRTVRNLSSPAARQRDVLAQAADLSAVLDALGQLDRDPASPLHGRLDLRHVGVFGHSRGGFAAPHACRRDLRFKACVNLDGWQMTPAVMDSGLTQPFMLVEEIAPWEPPPSDSELVAAKRTRVQYDAQARAAAAARDSTFGRMRSGAWLLVVHGARHATFSDQPFIAPERYRNIEIDARRALEIVNAYLLAFFDRHLRGGRGDLLDARPPYPEVTVRRYRPMKG